MFYVIHMFLAWKRRANSLSLSCHHLVNNYNLTLESLDSRNLVMIVDA
jgi:hypothetical protein